MKDHKNDSTEVLARFGRDRRPRTAAHAAERVERRPRLQRDAADSEQEPRSRRASYNPNFTRDNRPAFDEKSRRTSGGERPFRGGRPQAETDKPRFGTKGRTGAAYDGQSDSKPFGERGPKRFGAKPGAKGGFKKFSDKADSKFGPKKPGFRKDKPGFRKQDDKPRSYPKYDPAKQTGEMRLNRFLAQSGICSRREADDFITAGLVSVNGRIVTELGSKVMPSDEVRFNDSRVEGEKKVYLVLNKPKGYVTSLDDPHAGKLVMDLVAGACTERIYPVGRLDKNSLGLLLFTNDGDLTKQLTHPSYRKKKIYQVTLDKPLTRADMDRIAEGVTLEDGEIFADEISYVKENKQEVGIEIHSGRNRIVRRIFEFLGYTVTKLDRVYYAGLTKKNLKRGAWRFLTREEVERLKSGRYE
ncbi:pseudouridine synthase [uncultured Alistipes sp.]|uniref:pseudouridine synthase n=1 Tax=uncultured Alistipes sp. TaxID=538949 RepID=UPI002592F30D|nr:pseudouridine synthase [uncultured Alistipes sp.]